VPEATRTLGAGAAAGVASGEVERGLVAKLTKLRQLVRCKQRHRFLAGVRHLLA
jgi:hypothetical protein